MIFRKDVNVIMCVKNSGYDRTQRKWISKRLGKHTVSH